MGLFGRKTKATHTDPVCGMAVVEEEAIGPETVGGAVHYYCSAACLDTHRSRQGGRRKAKAEADVEA